MQAFTILKGELFVSFGILKNGKRVLAIGEFANLKVQVVRTKTIGLSINLCLIEGYFPVGFGQRSP